VVPKNPDFSDDIFLFYRFGARAKVHRPTPLSMSDNISLRPPLLLICRPQTNGKIERWFGLLEQELKLFPSIGEFVLWYNTLKHQMRLNLDEYETPEQAFWGKLPPERVLGYSQEWLCAA
jgi:transposase InsO family protein